MLNNRFFVQSDPIANHILKKFYTNNLTEREQSILNYRLEKTREIILSTTETLDELVKDYTKLTYFGVSFGYYLLKQLEPSLADNYNYKLHLKAIMIIMEKG